MIRRAVFRLRSPITSSLAISTCFFSWSPASPSNPRTRPPVGEASGSGDSDVYRDARKYARPSTVAWTERLHNSVSFIGTVEYPLKQIATRNDHFGVFTILRVKSSPDSPTTFRILVEMWDEIAQRALQHLKPNDYIYVSGQFGAYTKAALKGIERIRYKVTARELNYVKQSEPENCGRIAKPESEGESRLQKYRSRLAMWQIFFANPSEWSDQRKTKKTPNHPDFRHKSTGEALWLNSSDPPWVKKQLDLLDFKLSEGAQDAAASEFLSDR